MSFYFTPFPLVNYDPTGQNRPTLAIDITRRFKISQLTLDSALVYYDYEIKDHDRPDTMAHKYYGNTKLDWLFFVVNQKFDPYFQWPLNQYQFDNYIRQKYDSVAAAQSTIHHYEYTVQKRQEKVIDEDNVITVPARALVVDEATYNTLPISDKSIVTVYEHESALNEKNRKIKILSKDFLPEIMQSFEDIFK